MAQAHEVSTQYNEHIGKVAVMDLLDDYWFFHSTLFTTKQPPPSNSVDASSSSQASLEIKTTKQRDHSPMASSFLNQELNLSSSNSTFQLELPSSQQQYKSDTTTALPRLCEDPSTALLPFNSCYTKLRHSNTSTCTTNLISSGAGDGRPPRHMIKLEKTDSRYSTIRHFIAREAYYRKTFKEKKWRSLGDLDYIEIQGLKDLGFVLDKEDQLAQIMNARRSFTSWSTVPAVILNSQTTTTTACAPRDDAKVQVMRPYLSQRISAPSMFRWVNRKSADEYMKDQLRFWAKAVASNTKQLQGFFD